MIDPANIDSDTVDFVTWMKLVDKVMSARVGLSTSDLGDKNYRDWYDDGTTVKEAVNDALEDEGYFDGDFNS